jgi:hypothetical protein
METNASNSFWDKAIGNIVNLFEGGANAYATVVGATTAKTNDNKPVEAVVNTGEPSLKTTKILGLDVDPTLLMIGGGLLTIALVLAIKK